MDAIAPRRARSMEEFGATMGKAFVDTEIGASIAGWRPRPTDVVIAPYGKCGTTWLQQIFHTLRTGGDMDFEDISGVVPWIETAAVMACKRMNGHLEVGTYADGEYGPLNSELLIVSASKLVCP